MTAPNAPESRRDRDPGKTPGEAVRANYAGTLIADWASDEITRLSAARK